MTKRKATETLAGKTLGAQIADGLREAIAFERGELEATARRVPLTARKTARAPAPAFPSERIVALRARLKFSQPVFAMALNVSSDTVRAWEQGKRVPEGAALRLLEIAEEQPALLAVKMRHKLRCLDGPAAGVVVPLEALELDDGAPFPVDHQETGEKLFYRVVPARGGWALAWDRDYDPDDE